MRLEQLQYFAEVAKTNSIRLASENLFVSQPAISTAITKLEQELEVILFTRSKNGVFLTAIGEQILQEVIAAFDHIQQIKKIAHENKYDIYKSIAGSFSLRIPPAVSLSIFSDLHEYLQSIFPKMTLHCYESGPEEIRKTYTSTEYDLNIFSIVVNTHEENTILAFQKNDSNLILQQLYTCRLFVTAGKHTEIAKKGHISLEEFSQYPIGCLDYFSAEENYIRRLFKDKNKPLNFSFTTTNPDHLIKQIEKGICYSISDSLSQKNHHISYIPLVDPIKLQIWASYYTSNEKLPIITETIQFIKNYIPKNSIN